MTETSGGEPPRPRLRARPSDEAPPRGLDLARAQGEAMGRAVDYLLEHVADAGRELRAGDYLVTYAVGPATGRWQMRRGQLQWEEPKAGDVHIAIVVRDGADGRFVPGLAVQVSLFGPDGEDLGTHDHPFTWHPWLYHYGCEWSAREPGDHKLWVAIDAPTFARQDRVNGERYGKRVEVEFGGVRIPSGMR